MEHIDKRLLTAKEVATLFDEFLGYGDYAYEWDGTSDNGRVPASGIYFAQLRSLEHSQIIKLIYLK